MAAKKDEFGTNAAKPKGKPRGKGKPFEGANDPRRNNSGQRNKVAVETAAQARALYVQVLAEPISAPLPDGVTKLEVVVRQHVKAAIGGDALQREQMFDRIWGKSTQPIKHEFDDLPDAEIIQRAARLTARIAAGIAGVGSGDGEARLG